jgi:hypothetical protein
MQNWSSWNSSALPDRITFFYSLPGPRGDVQPHRYDGAENPLEQLFAILSRLMPPENARDVNPKLYNREHKLHEDNVRFYVSSPSVGDGAWVPITSGDAITLAHIINKEDLGQDLWIEFKWALRQVPVKKKKKYNVKYI